MEKALKIFKRPLSEHQPVVRVDEMSVVLHADTRPPILMQRGKIGRRDYEYKSCGSGSMFCGLPDILYQRDC